LSLLGLLALVTTLLQQPGVETATITGRVIDETTGRPIAGALVVVVDDRLQGLRRTTDPDGRFAFTGLTPGNYRVNASAGEFRATYVPSMERPRRLEADAGGEKGSSLVPLGPGQRRDLSIGLIRALAITGRVLDESSRPLSRVRIRLRQLETGRNIFGHMTGTDDRGAFRVFGLAPGRYLLCAETNSNYVFDSGRSVPSERFVNTCYPSAPDEGAATVVRLISDDVQGLEVRLRRESTYTISGSVRDAAGTAPDSFFLWLTAVERLGGSGSGHRIQGDTFTIRNVTPGRYAVRAEIGPDPSPSSRAEEMDVAFLDVTTDVEGLVMTTNRPVTVRGSITFDGPVPAGFTSDRVRIDSQPPRTGWPAGGRNVAVRDDHTFTLPDVFGPKVVLIGGLPAGTAVKSILYGGRDIVDRVTEFSSDPREILEVVLTTRVAELTGRVLDQRGEPMKGSRVYLFPADSTRWAAGIWPRAATTTSTGAYRIRNLAMGDYLAVAISAEDQDDIQAADWFHPYPHERLATIAETVHLLDNDRRTLDIRVAPIPQEWKR
jgi:protocatechuate 3,4-dioxygenase beta subunit